LNVVAVAPTLAPAATSVLNAVQGPREKRKTPGNKTDNKLGMIASFFDQLIPQQHPYKNAISPLSIVSATILIMTGIPAAIAATSPSEPDKSMAAAHESFVKGDIQKASAYIDKAAVSVKKDSEKVAASAKKSVKKAGEELEKLGQRVKNGEVKSDDELKKTFARVDNELAKGWYATGEESKKAGKDTSNALTKAGESLSGAANWSGTELKKGVRSSVNSVKAMGEGVKAGSEEVNKWFNDIGDGIKDVDRKL